MTIDPTTARLVHTIPGAADLAVERNHTYPSTHGPLPFELYRPTGAASPVPAVIFISGWADDGMIARFGKPIKDWASYGDWARAVATAGIVGITYANHEVRDVLALVDYVRTHADALGVDPDRIGVWACSGHGPAALGLLAKGRLACAALLYPYVIDVDGATDAATALAQFHVTPPPITLDDLPRARPILIVRAGSDPMPSLNLVLDRFVAAGHAHGLAITQVDHAEGGHSFDLTDDSPRTHAVVEGVLAFLRRALMKSQPSTRRGGSFAVGAGCCA